MTQKNTKKRISKVENTVDLNTGEIIENKVTTTYANNEPEYIKLYLQDISKILALSTKGEKTLLALVRKMNYDNEIVLTGKMKETMSDDLSIKKNTLEHGIGELVNSGILAKIGNNHYLVNPNIMGRGRWADIQQIIMKVMYNKSGKLLLKSEFDYQTTLEIPT